MQNVASFPKAKETLTTLLNLWSKLDGNAESFEPMTEGLHDVIVIKAVERNSAKGNPMKEIVWQDLDTGQTATTYTMKRGKLDKPFFEYTTIKKDDRFRVKHSVRNGFSAIRLIKDAETPVKTSVTLPTGLSKYSTKQTLYVYDIEVFKHDILIEIYDYFTGEWFEFENDLQGFRQFYLQNRDCLFVGYNNVGYDDHVIRGYLQGVNPYHLSKLIIDSKEKNAIYKAYNSRKTTLFSMDLYQDNRGFSLKEHSGFMGIDIRETQVDFDIDRPLTDDEKIMNRMYCKNDVMATTKRLEQNCGMLLAKLVIVAMFDHTKKEIGMTNANLTGLLLNATKVPDRHDDVEPYDLPDNLLIENQELLEHYVGRTFTPDENGKLDIGMELERKDLTEVFGVGGLHGAKKSYIRNGRFIFRDVGSLYPNTMILFDYLSRNIPIQEKHIYLDLLDQRMKAKYSNEKTLLIKDVEIPTKILINGIKLPLNTKYGAMGAKFNVLFDKRMRLHVCITGQLAMFDLLEKIEDYCTVIQSNTDAHAYIPLTETDEQQIDNICDEWSERTGYKLDKDIFKAIYQKDVNNYLAVDEDNHVKIKGAIGLTNGMKVSNAITSNAFINYVLSGYDFNKFIEECDELRQFQMITKTGYTFDSTIQVNAFNEELPANKVNRVFAIKDPLKAVTIYKLKENTFNSEYEVRDYYRLSGDDLLNATPESIEKNNTLIDRKISDYHEFKNEIGEWYERSTTLGLNNAPENYAISNEAIGEGIQLDEIDKEYYKKQVVELLQMWFGVNWKERLEESHNSPDFEPLPVKNYID